MTLFKNLLSLTGAELASKLVTFAAFAYLARVAGPDGFGLVEFAGSVLLCASLIVDQGFSPYGAREIARAPHRTEALVSEIVGVRCVLALAAYAAVLALAWGLDWSSLLTRLLLVYGLSLFAMPFLLQWVFQGHERMQLVAAAQVIRQIVFAAVVFACVHQAAQIWRVAAAEVAGATSAAVYCLWVYRRRFGHVIRLRLGMSRQLLREGVPIGLSQIFWVARMFGATLIVGLVASPADLGYFAGAQRILVALHAFVWLYFFNLLPSLARAWQEGEPRFATMVDASVRGVAWAAAAGGLAWVALAPAVMRGVYGPQFAPGGSTLAWLAGVAVLAALSGHYRFGLIAAGRQTSEMMTSAFGALVAVVCLPIGYRAGGTSGAAVALVVAELGVCVSAWWYAGRLLGLRHQGRPLVRPALAAAATAVLLWSVPLASSAVRGGVAIAVIGSLALLVDREVREHIYAGWALVRRQIGAPPGPAGT